MFCLLFSVLFLVVDLCCSDGKLIKVMVIKAKVL